MTLKEKQLEFIIYCIENTAERLGRYSADVYNKLKELGAIDGYINAFYDTLHTQGKAYIVDSLLEWHCPRFCVNRKLEDSSFILESCFQI